MKSIVLGGGCFWCIEAIYQQVRGVTSVVSGYAGGDLDNPTYLNHGTHAEVVQLTYDEKIIQLETILDIFFYVHDPTTLNRQGNDVGTQYRSIILCSDDELSIAETAKTLAQKLWDDPIVTEIKILDVFHEAEDYHHDYFNQNQNNPYCQVVINPKLSKFQSKFGYLLK
jgi:methionine-S-sulfoxide reductase